MNVQIDSLRISGPVSFFSHLEIVQRRFNHTQMLEIHRIKSELSVLPLSRRHIGTDSQRTGKYMASVVVGVLSDQIHTSRSKIGADIPLPSEMLCKTLQYFLLHPLLLSEPCSIPNIHSRMFQKFLSPLVHCPFRTPDTGCSQKA